MASKKRKRSTDDMKSGIDICVYDSSVLRMLWIRQAANHGRVE